MKQLFLILTLLMQCHLSFAQQMVSKEQLYKTVLTGFGQYSYALDHNKDSIEYAKANFEIYLEVLRNKETQKLAEDAWDSWQVLHWISSIYTMTNDAKEKDLIDFAFSYYEQNEKKSPELLFNVIEPAFTYFAQNGNSERYELTCNRLEAALSAGNTHSYLLACCKYFKTIAFMSKKDAENAFKQIEAAFELAQKEEKNYRRTYNYQYYVNICSNLVQAYTLKSNYQKAWNVTNLAEIGVKESYTDKSSQYLSLLSTKLDLALKMGKMSQVKDLVEQMDTLIAQSTLIDKKYAEYLSNGLNFYKQQLSITDSSNSSTTTSSNPSEELLQKAYQAVSEGKLDEAKSNLQQVLSKFEKTLNETAILQYYSLINDYVNVLLAYNQSQESISLIEHADSVITNLNKLDAYANRYFKEMLGKVYFNLNDYLLAKNNMEEAKRLYELASDHGSNYFSCLESLVEVYQQLGNFAYAKLLLNELNDFVSEAYKDNQLSDQLCIIQGCLGSLNARLGYKYEAREQLEKAIENIKDTSVPQLPTFRRVLALFYLQEGANEKALELFKENYETAAFNEKYIARIGLIFTLAKRHDLQALSYLREYNELTISNLNQMLHLTENVDLQSFRENTIYRGFIINNSLLEPFGDNPEMKQMAYDNTLYARLGISEVTKAKMSWSDVAKSLQPNEVAIEFVMAPENLFETDRFRYGALLLRNDYDCPQYVELCESEQMDSIIRNHIVTDKSFINKLYDVKNPMIYNFIFKKLTKYLKPKDHIYYSPTNLLSLVNLNYISDGKQRLSDKYDFHQVSSTALIADLKRKNFSCKGRIAVYGGVSYDESMDELVEEAKRYQIERSETNEMIQTLLAQDKSRGAMNGFLEGSLEEAIFIEKLFKQNGKEVDLYVGNKANEESLKAYSGKAPQILHISTHGFTLTTVNDQNEHRNIIEDFDLIGKKTSTALLYSGLRMAGSDRTWNGELIPKGVEDGIVTAYELSQLNLKGCDLTVLSACETGLGHFDTTGNEAGLKQALKQAGVGSIVFSLWQVPDTASSMLMQNFYQFILQGKQPREALQEAQEKVAKAYPEPYYWAGFSIID